MTGVTLSYSRDSRGRFIFHEPIEEQALLDIGQAIVRKRFDRGDPLPALADLYQWLVLALADVQQHALYLLLLDTQQRVIGFEVISKQSVDRYVLDPRLVLRLALIHSVNSIVIAQYKPHGIIRVESYDQLVLEKLKTVLRYLNIELVDYVMVAGANAVSLFESPSKH